MKIVSYIRVSTQKQGNSGLGLEAQTAAVSEYARRQGADIASTFLEVESGKKNGRPQLAAAIETARATGAVLVIAKLDRLARNAAFIFTLKDAGVQFVACDMPEANTLTIGMLAVMAQHEAEQISARTRAALAAKKARGAKLGTPANLTADARQKGRAAHSANAKSNPNTRTARGYASLLRAQGMALGKVAQRLNSEGYKTARGGRYSAVQVARLVAG